MRVVFIVFIQCFPKVFFKYRAVLHFADILIFNVLHPSQLQHTVFGLLLHLSLFLWVGAVRRVTVVEQHGAQLGFLNHERNRLVGRLRCEAQGIQKLLKGETELGLGGFGDVVIADGVGWGQEASDLREELWGH